VRKKQKCLKQAIASTEMWYSYRLSIIFSAVQHFEKGEIPMPLRTLGDLLSMVSLYLLANPVMA
jgi:hypothetical protein